MADPTRKGSTPISVRRVIGCRGVVGVQRGEHQVTGEGGLDGDRGGLLVTDLTDQHDVGILTKERTERRGEGQAGLLDSPGPG